MSISRDEVIETLDALAAPLEPLTCQDERLERQDRWVEDGGVELLEAVVALVASPPAEGQLQYASLDDWSTLLVEVAGTLGKRHPEVARQRLLPLLEDDHARAAAIDILGSIGDARAVPEFDRLVHGRRLGEDDLVHLAGALGEIGGDEACRLLVQLRQAVTPGSASCDGRSILRYRRLTASEPRIDDIRGVQTAVAVRSSSISCSRSRSPARAGGSRDMLPRNQIPAGVNQIPAAVGSIKRTKNSMTTDHDTRSILSGACPDDGRT